MSENLDQYKHEDNFKRCLEKLTIEDVRRAIQRADVICENNEKDGKIRQQYKGYCYYRENPALSIQEAVGQVLKDCGI